MNLVIIAGVDRGYEATIREVFRGNMLIGIVTLTVLASGCVPGVVAARLMPEKAIGMSAG